MTYPSILLLVLLSTAGFAQTLTAEEKILESWLPVSVGDYELDGTPLTVTSKADDTPYSMSSKVYKKDASTLTIVIFDYQKNPELLKKYTASWLATPVDDETQAASAIQLGNFSGWQSFNKKDHTSQLYVNVRDRYLLYLSGKENSPEFLNTVAAGLPLQQLPQ